MFVHFARNFMSSNSGGGQVTLRIDDRYAETQEWYETSDHEWLGRTGREAIEFIRSLRGGKTLFVRATPLSENPVSSRFTITGLDRHVEELAKTCKWVEQDRAEAAKLAAGAAEAECRHVGLGQFVVALGTLGLTEIGRANYCKQRAKDAGEEARVKYNGGAWGMATGSLKR